MGAQRHNATCVFTRRFCNAPLLLPYIACCLNRVKHLFLLKLTFLSNVYIPIYNVLALFSSPPTQPQLLHSDPTKQPQLPTNPNSNSNNRQAQQVYSGDTSYLSYLVDIKINLRSGRVLLDKQPIPRPSEGEEEREEIMPRVNPPPFLERLTQPIQPTREENELFGELKNLCVKIPLLQAIKDVPIYNKLIKEK